jgi:methylmalonyl-CoA mutase N-terminal domain/subunit
MAADGQECPNPCVGVNEFMPEEPEQPSTLYIDERVAETQKRKLELLRQRRSDEEVHRRLLAVQHAASQEPDSRSDGQISDANTMPYIVAAVRAYATVGEIRDALRDVYGTYTETKFDAHSECGGVLIRDMKTK